MSNLGPMENANNHDDDALQGMDQSHVIINLHTLMPSSQPITLKFMDLCYRVKIDNNSNTNIIKRIFNYNAFSPSDQTSTAPEHRRRTILSGITGMASPGEILAVLGPSGSGKSTLLNALAGRLHLNSPSTSLTGTILANNKNLSRTVSRQTGFVAQDDVLHPNLTVRETLIFCAMLKIPKLTKIEKIGIAESAISELGLGKCENTIIGDGSTRGVSGGERKRVSIAHEMIVNPRLMILDEPTSGLDSTAAKRLVETMRRMAKEKGMTVVASMHQPSSTVYGMVDKVLVLCGGGEGGGGGRCLYYGRGSEALGYFEAVGFWASLPVNPADFLLDLANGVFQHDDINANDVPYMRQTLISSYENLLAPKVKSACIINASTISPKHRHNIKTRRRCNSCCSLSSWFNQLAILLQRSLKERKHETFNSLKVIQVIAASLLAGLIWWHSDIRDVQDRLGLLFFIAIFWGVFPSNNSVFVFPQERAILVKERASNMYTLSSYFVVRIVGDLPMDLILPTIFLIITYWMTGLRPELSTFFLTLLVLLSYVLVSQGLGLALGGAIMDSRHASMVATITMLAFVLVGGFYVHKVPACMVWIKYVSTTYYAYRLLIDVQYGDGEEILSVLGCGRHGVRDHLDSCKFAEEDVRRKLHPAVCVGMLFIMFVGYRLLAYLALRRIRA